MREARVWQEAGSVVVDQQAYTIQCRSEFKLERRNSLWPKLPDCLGGGQLYLDLGEHEVGRYQVYSGEQLIGPLSVTSGLPWRAQCMSNSQEQ